jgi:hypothetical protein
MDDLRQRLERYSEGFDLDSGAAHRMFLRAHRVQRRRRLAAAGVGLFICLLAVTAAFKAFSGEAVPLDGQRDPSVLARHGIPEGAYWTGSVSRADVMRVLLDEGFNRNEADKFYFSRALPFDQTIRQGLVIEGGFWVQMAKNDSGQQEAGWSGNFEVLSGHRVAARGYGCTITYRYRLDGETLSLHVLKESGNAAECGRGDLLAQIAIFNPAPFVREASDPPSG